LEGRLQHAEQVLLARDTQARPCARQPFLHLRRHARAHGPAVAPLAQFEESVDQRLVERDGGGIEKGKGGLGGFEGGGQGEKDAEG